MPEHAHKWDESIYSRLPIAGHDIRLLKICAGSSEDPVICSLIKASLSRQCVYTCLSYAWGVDTVQADQHVSYHITVNRQTMDVNLNLFCALRRLRRDYADEQLWIDALCIDQSSTAEKTEQIGRMGEIYGKAAKLLVMLDDPRQKAKLRAQQDRPIGPSAPIGDVLAAVDFFWHLNDGLGFHEMPYFPKCAVPHCPSARSRPAASWSAVIEALKLLASSDWFNRTWTIQEIVLKAPKAIVVCGKDEFEWNLLCNAMRAWNDQLDTKDSACIMQLPFEDRELLRTFAGKVVHLWMARYSFNAGQPLIWQVLTFRSKKVGKDVRDKLYGILALQPEPHLVQIVPDADAPTQRTYTDFAKSLIEGHGWLVPLHVDLRHRLDGLRSWVPDPWFHGGDASDSEVAQLRAAESYGACGSFTQKPKIHDDDVLELLGVEVDTIVAMASPYSRQDRTNEQLLDLLDEWRCFGNMHKHNGEVYLTGESMKDALVRTAFGNKFHEGHICRPLEESDIGDWLTFVKKIQLTLGQRNVHRTYGLNKSMTSFKFTAWRRRLFKSVRGYIGLCPEACRVGDKMFVLSQCHAPIFLRSAFHRSDRNEYAVLGHGYVHGLMDGEALHLGIEPRQVFIV